MKQDERSVVILFGFGFSVVWFRLVGSRLVSSGVFWLGVVAW